MPGSGAAVVRRKRKCAECQRTFRSPEALRRHRYKFGVCRSEEALRAAGFEQKQNGDWVYEVKKGDLQP